MESVRRKVRHFAVLIFAFLMPGVPVPAVAVDSAEQMRASEAASSRGDFEKAAKISRAAQRSFRAKGDHAGEIEAMLREVAACTALGQTKLAGDRLRLARRRAKESNDDRYEARIDAAQGALLTFGNKMADPEKTLREALARARVDKDDGLSAQVLNDLGILLAGRSDAGNARRMFEQAGALARKSGNPALAAKAKRNLADALFARRDFPGAIRAARSAASAARNLPASHDRAFLLMGCGQLLQDVFVESPEHGNALRAEAFKLHREAQTVAEEIGDDRALSYALGYQGAMYEFEKRSSEALALTRRAIFHAQRIGAPEALYRWQWQAGRLLEARGERDAAVNAYRRAVVTLQSIRNDVSARYGNRNAGSSFRSVAGGLYFALADLLLQQADDLTNAAEVQALLRDARDTTELLKAAELDDYFQDDCANLLRAKTKKVDTLSTAAAIIYLIPLPTRTELLVGLPGGGMRRFKSPVGADELTEVVRRFRLNLEDRTTDAYLEQAQQLYAWLIKPIEPLMTEAKLSTMVFVPDGALRTVPMAALHDGAGFLIEKYAVAVSPGLDLMEGKSVTHGPARVLIAGLSEATDGFPPLPYVPREVERIEGIYSQCETLLDRGFRHGTVEQKLTGEPFTIVHLASHGQFDNDVRKSFVLTFDQKLTLDDLERFIRPGQLRDQPIELLTLSACQTAAGDDRAALGLAGVAVKAGARSAFATLWCVNDLASARLVGDFYETLKSEPDLTKAQALQSAQRKLLAESRHQHPCYWAPYLIIGNWL